MNLKMETQLYTSTVTGYRRKGTRLTELRAVLSAGILARTIFEPLQCCALDASAPEIKHRLEERGFDVVGVQTHQKGPLIGFAEKVNLDRGSIKEHTQPIRAEHLIADTTPLGDLFSVLHEKERVFVLSGTAVNGIVTRADLNKPPVRVYIFGLMSLLEMHLGFWIWKSYGDEAWKNKLKKSRIKAANTLQENRRGRNEQITLLDCLQFCDKRELVLGKKALRTKLGLENESQAKSMLGAAEDLRDRLVHSQHDLVQGASWPVLIELIGEIETLVNRSDLIVEQEAASGRKSKNGLWASR